ncbi:AP-1 complex subunit MU-1 [Hanseniaspora valbyensis NRRL Y-1626]|uniref:AP-1 complex subunit MU-1 n=1 Tax=Hanseniaspora valbyensis NRRL Y-1626 TaxID=766949 RepID=A0A1B7TG22_9ASCO|nr:AP-1 complex subunit MU-1 [Hanseniaspora valbyensis NRRL Y-1626]
MSSNITFCDLKGNCILSRKYRNDPLVTKESVDIIPKLLLENRTNKSSNKNEGVHYLIIKYNDILAMSLCSSLDDNKMDVFEQFQFLRESCEVLDTYLHTLTSKSLRENFIIAYELLDEMTDFGIPQITDIKMLKNYITQTNRKILKPVEKRKDNLRPPEQITGAINWRSTGIKYKKNEAFLDVLEKVNMTIDNKGHVQYSEILGQINIKSRLSGMPDVKVGLDDKGLITDDMDFEEPSSSPYLENTTGMVLEDLKFHQCVKLSNYENNKTITFIPPDGEFTLLQYKLNCTSKMLKPLILCDTQYDLHEGSRLQIIVRLRSNYKKQSIANNVLVYVPVTNEYDTPTFKHNHGKVKIVTDDNDPSKSFMVWKLKNLAGGKDYGLVAELQLPSTTAQSKKKNEYLSKLPTRIEFQIPYYTTSGIQVKYLKVNEPQLGYKTYPWVRYITESGDNYVVKK